LMFRPVAYYFQTRTVAEWMIYRFLVSSFMVQVALLIYGASTVSARVVSIALHEEVHPGRPLYSWLRTPWFWALISLSTCLGVLLVWPSAVELWKTGHTSVHWSRFVVAISCFSSAALLLVFRGIDRVLDLVEERVQYLAKRT
jgi:hypothetical protein